MNLDSTIANDQPASIGRYRILSELGRGSMAKVYLAQDPVVDRKLALKVISPIGPVDAVTWQTLRTRFLLEARAAGKLQHPNAVAIYDADTDDESGLSYIAMEWVDGRSLDKLLNTRGPIPIEKTISIVQQMASALDAANSQGLIHRDVKPANILIGQDGQAKLSDFGIVKFEDMRLTSTGGVIGTPLYMSPEQIRGEALDGRSDLFSLGVVLYQCLTGVAPFIGDTVAGLTHQILNADPRAPHWSDPSIPDNLSATVLQALAKDPSARPQTGAELSRKLSVALSDSDPAGLVAVPPEATSTLPMSQTEIDSVLEKGAKRSKTRTLLLVALAVLTLLAVLALFLDNTSQPTAPAPTHANQGDTGTKPPAALSQPDSSQAQLARPQPKEPTPSASDPTTQDTGTHPQDTNSSDPTTQSPTQVSTTQSEDNWVDRTEEIVDDAERIYRVSVGKTKRWWDRHAKKSGGKSKGDNKSQGKKKGQ